MRSIEITTKSNVKCVIKVNENDFNKTTRESYTSWETGFEAYDQNEEMFGRGKLEIKCNSNHAHVSDEDIIWHLLDFGVKKIEMSIEDGVDITSIAYRFLTHDCKIFVLKQVDLDI